MESFIRIQQRRVALIYLLKNYMLKYIWDTFLYFQKQWQYNTILHERPSLNNNKPSNRGYMFMAPNTSHSIDISRNRWIRNSEQRLLKRNKNNYSTCYNFLYISKLKCEIGLKLGGHRVGFMCYKGLRSRLHIKKNPNFLFFQWQLPNFITVFQVFGLHPNTDFKVTWKITF